MRCRCCISSRGWEEEGCLHTGCFMYFLIPYNGRPSRSALACGEVKVRGVPVSAGICPGRRGCQKYRTDAVCSAMGSQQGGAVPQVSPPSFSSPCKSNLSCPCAPGLAASSPQSEGARRPAPFIIPCILIVRPRNCFTSIHDFTCLQR